MFAYCGITASASRVAHCVGYCPRKTRSLVGQTMASPFYTRYSARGAQGLVPVTELGEEDVLCEVMRARWLGSEIACIVQDTLADFVQDFGEEWNFVREREPLHMAEAFEVLLVLLSTHQSARTVDHTLKLVRMMIARFPRVFFDGSTDYCQRLCDHLLQCCATHVTSIRTRATAILYVLMHGNFAYKGGSFSRVKVQATISLSKVRTEAYTGWTGEAGLRRVSGVLGCIAVTPVSP